MDISSVQNIKLVKEKLNDLSGVVAVDMNGNKAIAHCGDKLETSELVKAAESAGCNAQVISQYYEI
jgi:cystathionine beta-lyase/cystathionine gamma-synthase